jgi:hypothetical protein
VEAILTRASNIVYLIGKNGFHACRSIRVSAQKRSRAMQPIEKDDDLGGRVIGALFDMYSSVALTCLWLWGLGKCADGIS